MFSLPLLLPSHTHIEPSTTSRAHKRRESIQHSTQEVHHAPLFTFTGKLPLAAVAALSFQFSAEPSFAFRLLVVSTIGVPCSLALGWAPFAAWITGRFNVIGQWAFTTSIDFSLAQLIKEIILLSIGGKKGGVYDAISMYRGIYAYMLQ
ncbi:hypothetical protein Tsubulata_040057 [Turnera subulata]|uniref:Uncharacterized protein n=1 Tax=Turnera subulata TaxID=218843 RepID=A0A9Q0J583_9ROSI|nr:hypothetical protein Tsubulata_040057 [Turnera subulata]